MNKQPPNRKYRNSLDFVESGFRACWHNAQDLVLASQKLIESSLHAPGLSLTVLALEELAKLHAIDGLLFARHDQHKADIFRKSGTNHSVKLTLLELFPLLLGNLARADPRYGKEKRYNRALAISLQNLKEDGNAVITSLGESGFLGLNGRKQQGFYVSATDRCFVAPRDAIEPSFARAVHRLAWRATTTLDFVLKGGNLERYFEKARSVRAALTEEGHQELERIGEERFKEIFLGFRKGGDSALHE